MNKNKRAIIKNIIGKKRCKYCHATENLTIDHKIPIIQGGKDELSNLQCLCSRCNSVKSGLSDKQVKILWKWFMEVQRNRIKSGAKPLFAKIVDIKFGLDESTHT